MNTKNYKKNKIPQMKTVGKTSKPKIDKNQLLAIILAGLIIFWTVASVFGFIGYARSKKTTAKSGVIQASAETVDYYDSYGSLIIDLPLLNGLTYVSSLNSAGEVVNTLPSLYLEVSSNSITIHSGTLNILERYGDAFVPFDFSVRSAEIFGSLSTDFVSFACTKDSGDSMPVFANWSLMSDIKLTYDIQYISGSNSTTFCFFIEIDFTYDNVLYPFRYKFAHDLGTVLPNSHRKFYVPFTDTLSSNPKTFANYDAYGFPLVDFIKYYNISSTLDPDALLSYDLGVNDGIKIGKEQGHAIGFSEGYQDGYEDGYTEGNTEGYDNGHDVGYQEGLDASNEYSFTNLIGAVIDVPVRTFTSLFSFDILGVNLSVFFFSLLTLAIILAVVRILL